jgi:hypothetical protein
LNEEPAGRHEKFKECFITMIVAIVISYERESRELKVLSS